ncbi:MAG: endonuclease MutS2 [Gemmatimonadota bacterium]
MTEHALEVLEFGRVLERVAGRASSELGREHVRSLRPGEDVDAVRHELGRVTGVMRFVEAAPSWGPGAVPDIRAELEQLGVDGAMIEAAGIHRIGLILESSRLLGGELDRHPGGYPELAALRERLVVADELERKVRRTVDDEGAVLSTASAELKRIRDRLRGAHARIVRRLESVLRSMSDRFIVPDASVTIREGRYVIPIRREGKGEVGGIVHDESQTGATLFVEPPAAIEAMNELRELEREEGREIVRILRAVSAELAPHRYDVEGALLALIDFDSLHARARTAVRWDATPPRILDGAPAGFVLREARHPLLVEAGDGPVVPYDLDLSADERCMVVSGPNTGGKSVFLKATGLISALTQSGVVPPVGAGTVLPVFTAFFADIGDEQSISQSLSTFSAHLSNLSGIVADADAGALVLIDEMGTGTDPAEGAALARATLEELVRRGATIIASSHLGELKQLDTPGSGIVNASLQFDGERMEPTYRIVKGRPGRSFGLAIARGLGFPGAVLDAAEAYREEGAAALEDVVTRLEAQETEVERLVHELDLERARATRLREDLETREATLRSEERTAEGRARTDARKLLMDARGEVDRVIEELRASVEAGVELDEAARQARRSVESAAAREGSAARELNEARGDGALEEIDPGMSVRVRQTGAIGTVVEVRGRKVTVEVGALRLEVRRSDVDPVEAPKKKPRGGWKGPSRDHQVRQEIDLRGMRVDEIGIEVDRALDEALLEDLSQLRIIHGKGTGALRQRVTEILDQDARVRSFRMGGPGEGGAGVTVAEFRG